MLSAIAVDIYGKPGRGFFNWAKELGVMHADEDEDAFLLKEQTRIYQEWKISYRISKSKE